jgi:TM2 domain-containing membrane protein YozV
MTVDAKISEEKKEELIHVDLRTPAVAAVLAWLWPGAGHIYQRRYGKGLLFMCCIVSTFVFGLTLSGGQSVYASNRTWGRRLVYGCQLGVGLPAFPAMIQSMRVSRGSKPLFNGIMTPPRDGVGDEDDLSRWNYKYGAAFDLGVLYTMVAGLLNLLVIFDAYGGPMVPLEDEKKRKPPNTPATAGSEKPPA